MTQQHDGPSLLPCPTELDELLERFGLVLTDDPEFGHDEQTFGKARDAFVDALRIRPTQPAEGLVDDEAELLWCGQIDALVDDAFETVSRNPSDHEIAVAYRRAILRALRSPEPSEGWQPIETAPKDGTWVQTWSDSYGLAKWAGDVFPDDPWDGATHWRPLPAPPSQSLPDR